RAAAPVRRRRLRRLQRTDAPLYRRAPEARASAAGDLRSDRELVPPPGAGRRGARQSRFFPTQSLGRRAACPLLPPPADTTRGIPLPGSRLQSLSGVRGDAYGGP